MTDTTKANAIRGTIVYSKMDKSRDWGRCLELGLVGCGVRYRLAVYDTDDEFEERKSALNKSTEVRKESDSVCGTTSLEFGTYLPGMGGPLTDLLTDGGSLVTFNICLPRRMAERRKDKELVDGMTECWRALIDRTIRSTVEFLPHLVGRGATSDPDGLLADVPRAVDELLRGAAEGFTRHGVFGDGSMVIMSKPLLAKIILTLRDLDKKETPKG